MFWRILFVLAGMPPIAAGAVECELIRTPVPQTSWQNVQVRTANSEITLLSGQIVSNLVRDDIENSLKDQSMSFADVANRATRILAQNEDILADSAVLLLYLKNQLNDGMVKNVYIDVPENIEQWEARVKQMYLEIFQMQMRSSHADVSLDRMILIAAGPALYLRVVDPRLYNGVELSNLPSTPDANGVSLPRGERPPRDQVEPPPQVAERSPIPSSSPTSQAKAPPRPREEERTSEKKPPSTSGNYRKAADDAFEELEDSLSKNRSTLSSVRSIRREIHSGRYDGLSNEEAKDRASSRVWSQARNKVRGWVELEMKARRESRRSDEGMPDEFSSRRRRRHVKEKTEKETQVERVSPSKKSKEKAKFSFPPEYIHATAETLLARPGKAIGFLRQDWYDRLLKEYETACASK